MTFITLIFLPSLEQLAVCIVLFFKLKFNISKISTFLNISGDILIIFFTN